MVEVPLIDPALTASRIHPCKILYMSAYFELLLYSDAEFLRQVYLCVSAKTEYVVAKLVNPKC